jgi:epoxyqueuosine reductase
MGYLARNIDKRTNPFLLLDSVKTIVVLGYRYPSNVIYGSNFDTLLRVCKYATVSDYHITMKGKLKELCEIIRRECCDIGYRCFVDSGIVMEKVWGVESGLGWLGRNGLLMNDVLGSFFHIGVIFLDYEVASDNRLVGGCGDCRLCVDSCPTGALLGDGLLDSRRCISCYTVERGVVLDSVLDNAMVDSGYVYGCDICQDVCPYNVFRLCEGSLYYSLPSDLLRYSVEDFDYYFSGSVISRVGYDRFMRGVRLVLGLGGDLV